MRCAVEVLVAALKVTVPLPGPLAPPLILSHGTLLVAVHVHPLAAVTAVVDDPPAAVIVWASGDTPNVHAAPVCVTVTAWPATVSVPTRWDVEVFAVALKVTVPLPFPLAPPLMVSQAALLVAVQVHPVAAVTAVVADAAAEVSVADVGETPKVHAAPVWVTVTGWPATVSVPTRWAVEVLAVALKVTVPLPFPLAPPLMVSQAALLVAVQAQPLAAVTAVVADPPVEVSVAEVGETPNEQVMPLWVTVTA
jgi:hypothetical protein